MGGDGLDAAQVVEEGGLGALAKSIGVIARHRDLDFGVEARTSGGSVFGTLRCVFSDEDTPSWIRLFLPLRYRSRVDEIALVAAAPHAPASQEGESQKDTKGGPPTGG